MVSQFICLAHPPGFDFRACVLGMQLFPLRNYSPDLSRTRGRRKALAHLDQAHGAPSPFQDEPLNFVPDILAAIPLGFNFTAPSNSFNVHNYHLSLLSETPFRSLSCRPRCLILLAKQPLEVTPLHLERR